MRKIIASFTFTLILTLYSCGSADLTIGGSFNGTIADYTSGTIDSIRVSSNFSRIGQSSVSSTGKFSMNLSTPTGGNVITNGMGSSIVISDPETIGSSANIYATKNNSEIGSLVKCNFTHSTGTVIVGDAVAELLYVDRPCTIKGTYTYSGTSYTQIININLIKGWNEVFAKVTTYTQTGTNTTETLTITSSIPTDLKWRYIPNSPMYIKRFQLPILK